MDRPHSHARTYTQCHTHVPACGAATLVVRNAGFARSSSAKRRSTWRKLFTNLSHLDNLTLSLNNVIAGVDAKACK